MVIEEYQAERVLSDFGLVEPSANRNPVLRAIDLYSGIGGWGLGLKLAGISTIASYELSQAACDTQLNNLAVPVLRCDIRKPLPELPADIDIVVGSPPCTQFSFSNRGGSGDITDGLKDLARFLSVVEEVQPRMWAFENVPRVEGILRTHVYGRDGKLKRFKRLFEDPETHIRIFDMSRFGLPQRRMRCVVGRFPVALLESYAERCKPMTLADVISKLRGDCIQDPLYSVSLPYAALTEHEMEPALTAEEARLNRDAKCFHPIYNKMEFPDDVARPVRAITATCTRVSRESVIVPSEATKGRVRRLTLRERASLQGFPINYQFYASSRSAKMEMIGNAIPPLFVYYLACAMRGVPADSISNPRTLSWAGLGCIAAAPVTPPNKARPRFSTARRFRGVIPSLYFKSGVRFEISNELVRGRVRWRMKFYYGNSKDIRMAQPDGRQYRRLMAVARKHRIYRRITVELRALSTFLAGVEAVDLQRRWARRGKGLSPHSVVGQISAAAGRIGSIADSLDQEQLLKSVQQTTGLLSAGGGTSKTQKNMNQKKFEKNCAEIFAGLICASWFNGVLKLG